LRGYGKELILDLHHCDVIKFNRRALKGYFKLLCQKINMTPHKLCWWDDVGVPEGERQTDAKTKGTSAVQFIMESNVTVHTLELLGINGIMCRTGISGGDKVITIHSDRINLDMVLGNKVVFGSVNANRTHFEQGLIDLEIINKKWPGLLEKIITRRVSFSNFKEAFIKKETDIKVIVTLKEDL